MRTQLALALCAAGLTGFATAQVTQLNGPSPNLTTALDFDTPFVATGPITSTSTVFTNAGITSVNVIGTPTAAGDTLTAASNVMGQGLVTQGGVLTVAGAPDPLDNVSAGGGWEIVLASPVDEFQALFIDQINMPYDVELLNGATSLGTGSFTYGGGFPSPPHYWRGPSQFDTIRITFPTSVGVGIDEFAFGNGPPPPPPPINCVNTGFSSNNLGNVGGGIYFDLTVTQNVSFSGLLTNTGVTAGLPVGLGVYLLNGTTYAGNELNQGALLAEDDGTAVSAGDNNETAITFLAPFTLAPGTYAIAIEGINPTTGDMLNHEYTNGTGTNQTAMSSDGVITLNLGSASNVGFTAPIFTPRVWNGELCHGQASPGTNYCNANANSTGQIGMMGASGSSSVMANNLVLEAAGLPNNSFAFFITSQTQGFVANPAGSQGNLCLLGAIGRYVGPGQIVNSGGNGMISLAINNSQQPTPTGLVQVVAGETWNFQAWYRDFVGAPTSNFTDGLEVLFSM